VYSKTGPVEVFAIMAGLTALATVPVLIAREPRTVENPPAKEARPDVHFLQLPGAWRIIALVAVYKFGEAAAQGMIRPFLVDHHLRLWDIAFVVGKIGFLAGMAGALIGGTLVGFIGRKRALIAFGVGQVVSVLGYAYLAFGEPTYRELYMWTGVEHFASGMATAAVFTAMMDWCRPQFSGSDYTVQASAVVIATGVSSTLAGVSADLLGYGVHFIVCAGICVVAVVVAAKLFPTPFPAPLPEARTVR
jgi:PAT family beta-lactamase induction signal transducer AmpG